MRKESEGDKLDLADASINIYWAYDFRATSGFEFVAGTSVITTGSNVGKFCGLMTEILVSWRILTFIISSEVIPQGLRSAVFENLILGAGSNLTFLFSAGDALTITGNLDS